MSIALSVCVGFAALFLGCVVFGPFKGLLQVKFDKFKFEVTVDKRDQHRSSASWRRFYLPPNLHLNYKGRL